MTAAYKRKLQEDQQWLAEEKVREAKEAEYDVVKTGHMGNFYRWGWAVCFASGLAWKWLCSMVMYMEMVMCRRGSETGEGRWSIFEAWLCE